MTEDLQKALNTLKNTQAALQVCEHRLTAVFEKIPGVVFFIAIEPNEKFRFSKINQAFLASTGLSENQVVGKLIQEVIPPESVNLVLANYKECIRTRSTVRWEEASEYPTGLMYGEVAVSPIFDESGACSQLVGLVLDTTERKMVELEREQYFKFFLNSSDIMVIVDDKERLTKVNPACLQILGYSEQAILRKPFLDFIHPDDIQITQTAMVEARQGPRSVNFENRILCKDAETRWLSWNAQFVVGEGLTYATARDITERKTAEAALRASEQQLQSYLDHAGDGIYVLESESGRILNANTHAMQMLGYSLDELLKMSAADIEAVHSPASIHTAHQRTIHEVVAAEGIHRRKDGSTFPVEIRMTSLAPAQPHLVLSLVRDITERKTAEAALQDEARRKDEFLAVLGHELRNPLAVISTAIQMLSGGVTADRRARIEESMVRQVTLMRRLLDDLLDFSRIEHGHIELKKERIDLAEFLQKATASLQPVIANRRQELLLRLPSESVQFIADRIRLEQIATNLLSNASKYTGQGGRIELSGAREGSEVVLHCKDNGQGVLPEYQEKIFEPFTRGRKTQDSHGEASLGIGLALTKQLTELHGGTISVESAGADMGSDFIVRLPLVAPASDIPVAAEPKHALLYHRGYSIVIVEDNPDFAEVMETALEQAGHSVRMFRDGPSALAGVADLKPDAVLLDIGLPGMDGYELLVELKKQINMRDALFIALSGFKPRDQTGQEGGDFDYYFTKPVDVHALVALLDTRLADASRKHREPKKTRQLRVLLVEDHPDLAAATASLLRGEDFEVQTALTGREALEAAPNFRPQLIFCDLNLPDMGGLEVIRALRSIPSTQQTHAVILTALSEMEIRAYNSEAGELGVDAFMSKPIKVDAVRTMVSKLKP